MKRCIKKPLSHYFVSSPACIEQLDKETKDKYRVLLELIENDIIKIKIQKNKKIDEIIKLVKNNAPKRREFQENLKLETIEKKLEEKRIRKKKIYNELLKLYRSLNI
jgi:hypothetical protein